MSRNKRTIQTSPGGPLKEAVIVPIVKSSENWNEYMLEDGTVLKLKPVVMEILRVENEYAPDGNPFYVIKATNVVHTDSPDSLRKPR